jgi:FHA domain
MRCLVGRASTCHLVLDNSDASREHAVIFYDGGSWNVRDLSSRNGTLVGAERVVDTTPLRLGEVVRFGSERNAWKLIDAAPPAARAVSRTSGSVVLAEQAGLFLPNAARCEAFISNQDGQWCLERMGEVRAVADQEELTLADEVWTLELTVGEECPSLATVALDSAEVRFVFKVSRDEEYVELVVTKGGRGHSFTHRSHIYLLLLLARARLEDQLSSETLPGEHGWVETKRLANMLKTSSEQINVWVWRAREQFQKIDADLAHRLVERRPALGQLRIGFGELATELL